MDFEPMETYLSQIAQKYKTKTHKPIWWKTRWPSKITFHKRHLRKRRSFRKPQHTWASVQDP